MGKRGGKKKEYWWTKIPSAKTTKEAQVLSKKSKSQREARCEGD